MRLESRRKKSPRTPIHFRGRNVQTRRSVRRSTGTDRSLRGPGRLIVVAAPSGSGKTTIAHAILERNPSFQFSVSATTRPKRLQERDGKDYYFLTKEEFRQRVAADEFVEWEEIYSEYYGTLRREIDRARRAGESMLFDIDVKGALSIKAQYPDALLIFIRPPTVDVLVERLRKRHTEDEPTLARRLERVPMEMELGKAFDVEVVNDDLPRAIDEVQSIIEKNTQKH